MRPANYAEWRKEQLGFGSAMANLSNLQALGREWNSIAEQQIRIKALVCHHIAEGPAREHEALKRAHEHGEVIVPLLKDGKPFKELVMTPAQWEELKRQYANVWRR